MVIIVYVCASPSPVDGHPTDITLLPCAHRSLHDDPTLDRRLTQILEVNHARPREVVVVFRFFPTVVRLDKNPAHHNHQNSVASMAPGGQQILRYPTTERGLTHGENRCTAFSKTPTSHRHPIHLLVHDMRIMRDFPSVAEI